MAADESFNLDSLLDDINQVVSKNVIERSSIGGGDVRYVPHPPPQDKSPSHVSKAGNIVELFWS